MVLPSSTTINASTGLLTVNAAETAASLTVTATSVFDNTKQGAASVTVPPLTLLVTGVVVLPATTTKKGATQQFTANVAAQDGASEEVTWSVTSNALTATSISTSGLLPVASGGTANTLTVTATSVFDNTKKGTATETVENVTGTVETLRNVSTNLPQSSPNRDYN